MCNSTPKSGRQIHGTSCDGDKQLLYVLPRIQRVFHTLVFSCYPPIVVVATRMVYTRYQKYAWTFCSKPITQNLLLNSCCMFCQELILEGVSYSRFLTLSTYSWSSNSDGVHTLSEKCVDVLFQVYYPITVSSVLGIHMMLCVLHTVWRVFLTLVSNW